jgi:hypothetical protein
MTNRNLKPNLNSKTRKPVSRLNRPELSPSNNLLKLIIMISNHHKSHSAEKAIKQKIADILIDHTIFCHDFSDRLDDNYRPIKVNLIFESLKFRNIIIQELVGFYKRNKKLNPGPRHPSRKQPQVIAINPIQPLPISKTDRDIIFNFKNSRINWVKKVYQDSTNNIDQEIFDKTTKYMLAVDHLMSSKAKKSKRVDVDDLLWARAKYEVHRHTQLHRVDVTQIGKIAEILNRSFCEELEKLYQDYLEEERQQNN